MLFNICPFCQRPIPGPKPIGSKQDVRCSSCGAELCRIPDIHFSFGIKLAATGQKKNRVACPFCQTRYCLDLIPGQKLIGCHFCHKLFAVPQTDSFPEEKPAGQEEMCYMEDICFPYGTRLAANSPEKHKFACPHCKTHYLFDSLPPYGLVSCRTCLKIFAVSQEKEISGLSVKYTVPSQPEKTGEIPIRQGVIPNLSNWNKHGEIPVLRAPIPVRVCDDLPEEEKISPPGNHESGNNGSPKIQVIELPPPPSGNVGYSSSFSSPGEGKPWQNFAQLLGNLVWLLFGGLYTALGCFFGGILLCLTIIGIPFAIQVFKICKLELSPFGSDVVEKTGENGESKGGCLSVGMNILWILIGGWINALIHLLIGAVLFLTIIGIPFAKQHFKLAYLVLVPFGKTIRRQEGALPIYVSVILAIIVGMINMSWKFYSMFNDFREGFQMVKQSSKSFSYPKSDSPGKQKSGREEESITVD